MTALLLACLSLPVAPVFERQSRDFDNSMWEYFYIDQDGKPRGVAPDGQFARKRQLEIRADKTFIEYFWYRDERWQWRGGAADKPSGTWEFKDHTLFLRYWRSNNRVDRFHFSGLSPRVRYEIGEQKFLVNMWKVQSLKAK